MSTKLMTRLSILCSLIAVWIVLPPLLVGAWLPSVLVGAVAFGLAVAAIRSGAGKQGWAGAVFALLAVAVAVWLSGAADDRLSEIFVWSALAVSTIVLATPIAFAALGGLVSERSGVMNIGLEGMMLSGAFFGVLGADLTGSWVGGLLVGVVSGMVLGLLFAIFTVGLGANQIVAGVGVNFLALGVTGYFFLDRYGSEGTPVDLPAVPAISLPLGWLGPVGEVFDRLNLLIWVCFAATLALHWLVFHSSIGLRLRAVGEHPSAADTAGIKVHRVRTLAVVTSGMLASLGGIFLSLGFVNGFNENMSAGRGFIALAAMIFGAWRPFGALGAALLFGFSSALTLRVPDLSPATSAILQALPYVLTIIVVAGVVGRVMAPAAIGIPYRRSKG